jgi:hypothetical protein
MRNPARRAERASLMNLPRIWQCHTKGKNGIDRIVEILNRVYSRFPASSQALLRFCPFGSGMRHPLSDQIPSILLIGPHRFERNIYLSKDTSLA